VEQRESSANLEEELLKAAREGDVEKVKDLLARGADPNAIRLGTTPLHIAAGHGRFDIVKILVENGANVNVKDLMGFTPLHSAILGNHLAIVKFLIENGADVNAKVENCLTKWNWCTSLHLAAFAGDPNIIRFLIDRGADLNAKDGAGLTPLHIAARYGHPSVVELLIHHGADVNAKSNTGSTPLHEAIEGLASAREPQALDKYLNVAKLLIDHGGDVNAKEGLLGWTPLHCAAKWGFDDLVKLLLESGADPAVADLKGRTPADVAEENNNKYLAETIRSWSKKIIKVKPSDKSQVKIVAVKKKKDKNEKTLEKKSNVIDLVDISSRGVFRVGEWGWLSVKLKGEGVCSLKLEGDLEYIVEDAYTVGGEASIEVAVKPKVKGEIPVKIVIESKEVKVSRVIRLKVGPAMCSKCGAPIEPGAKYCWKCGTKLS
jgi:ankyrin repeat protein/ribosomal protein L40E